MTYNWKSKTNYLKKRKTGLCGLIGCMVLVFVLTSSAYGLKLSASMDGNGAASDIKASKEDGIEGSISLDTLGISSIITGTADLTESHWVSNKAGAYAEVGVSIQGAKDKYSYAYTLIPREGSGITDPEVAASESLNVPYAAKINAYARARDGTGNTATASTDVIDGSLLGYYNSASATANGVDVSQGFDFASGSIRTDSGSFLWGSNRIPKGPALDQWAKILPETGVSTLVLGTITNYADSSTNSNTLSQTQQEGHILGTLTSTANSVGLEPVTRNPSYGTEYDMHMAAIKGISPEGTLSYYVDDDRNEAIQGAVDDAWSGDTINVKAGIYNENVAIDKSLTVAGSGAGNDPSQNTIVTGLGLSGSVFTIGSDTNSDLHVALSGMTITDGSGTIGTWAEPSGNTKYGGGIWNAGDVDLNEVIISGNSAGIGGGIYNQKGTVTLIDSEVSGNVALPSNGAGGAGIWNWYGSIIAANSKINNNHADSSMDGGGLMNNWGIAVLSNCEIAGNTAGWSGAGITTMGSDAALIVDGCNIHDNRCNYFGGGIQNSVNGKATITNSIITGNWAGWGGGIATIDGASTDIGDTNSIYGNTPQDLIG